MDYLRYVVRALKAWTVMTVIKGILSPPPPWLRKQSEVQVEAGQSGGVRRGSRGGSSAQGERAQAQEAE